LHPDELNGVFATAASGFFVARLKNTVVQGLVAKGFDELEPRYIHNLRPVGSLEPLQVVFPGYGSPAYLLVSPIPELRAASLVIGITSAFSVARSFSQTVRDGYTSAESLVIGLIMTGSESRKLIDLCIELVYASFGNYSTMAANWADYAFVGSWRDESMLGASSAVPLISQPTILRNNNGAFALAWPRPRVRAGNLPQPLLVVEGANRENELDGGEGTAIIHIERMAKAISDDLTLRM
jgi:hypothetical protein